MTRNDTDFPEVRVLGPPTIELNARPLAFEARKPLAIIWALALRPEGISRDELAHMFWPSRGRNNLRTALYRLRGQGGADTWLVDEGGSERLRLQGYVDLRAFESAIAKGHHGQAFDLWPREWHTSGIRSCLVQGVWMPEAPKFHDLLEIERDRVFRTYRAGALAYANILAADRAFGRALALLDDVIVEDPLDEEIHRRIMAIAWRAGDYARAVRQYEACRRSLTEELGLPPMDATRDLYEAIRSDLASVHVSPAQHSAALVGDSIPFIGRRRELGELHITLEEARWVTLVGIGGVGKTRLARVMAVELRARSERPVVYVPLESVGSCDFAVAAIANAAQIGFEGDELPVEQLARGLSGRRIVLVLDNIEHLLPGLGPALETLLARAEDATILATSRVAADCPTEHAVFVQGLEFGSFTSDLGHRDSDAVRLFVTAARLSSPQFRLDEHVLSDVLRVCSGLRGHPLGLRLAAGWLRFCTCGEVADRIESNALGLDNPGVAVDARHGDIRRMLEDTWVILGDDAKDRLVMLSVFRGPFDVAAAYHVAHADSHVLKRLVSSGWLELPSAGSYELHPLIRSFGYERLQTDPAEADVNSLHATWYLERLTRRESAFLSREPRDALDATESEWENLRAAWTFACRNNQMDLVEAATTALSLYADIRVRFLEAVHMFSEALDALENGASGHPQRRARLLCGLSSHLYRLARFQEALDAADEAVKSAGGIGGELGDSAHAAVSLRATILMGLGRYSDAADMARIALRLSRASMPGRVSRDLRGLANAASAMGWTPEAEGWYREAIDFDREMGYSIGLAINLNNVSELLIETGRFEEAEAMIRESRELAADVDIHLLPYLELNLARLEELRGRYPVAETHGLEAARLARSYRQSPVCSRAEARLASIAIRVGRLADAERHGNEALRIARDSDDAASAAHALAVRSRLLSAQGDSQGARACATAVLEHDRSEARDRKVALGLLDGSFEPHGSKREGTARQGGSTPE